MPMKARYTVVEGEVIAQKRNGMRHLLVPDAQGSTVALMGSSSTITDTFDYWPGGQVRTRTGTTVIPTQFLGALGMYKDSESRSYLLGQSYRPDINYWQTVGPLAPSIMRQAVRNNNPLPIEPNRGCNQGIMGETRATRNPRFSNCKERPGSTISIDVRPFGIGISFTGTTRVVTCDAFWTVAIWRCVCEFCRPVPCHWKLEREYQCKGTYIKQDIVLPTMTDPFILSEVYFSSGGPGCPKREVTITPGQNVLFRICFALGVPRNICEQATGK